MTYAYRLGTLQLASDLELPELTDWDGPSDAPADVAVRIGRVPPRLDVPDHVAPLFQTRGRCEYLLALPGTGRILVKNGAEVTVDPDPEAEPVDTGALITGPVQAIVWHQRRLLPLRASAVLVNGRAIALAGPAASGKSTLAAVLSVAGHAVLADNTCVLDTRGGAQIRVLPGSSRLRLWHDALDHLGISPTGLGPALSGKAQFILGHGALVREPQSLAAVVAVVRRPSGALMSERLHGVLAVATMRDLVHMRRAAQALGREAEIFADVTRIAMAGVPIWTLRVPDDHACLAQAAARILAIAGA